MRCAANGNRDKSKAENSATAAEQQGFKDGFANNRARPCAQGQPDRSLRRPMERTSSRPATLTQATSKTVDTARKRVRGAGRMSA
jgi:hypothetical protein